MRLIGVELAFKYTNAKAMTSNVLIVIATKYKDMAVLLAYSDTSVSHAVKHSMLSPKPHLQD
jgi:hypothetical protein